MCILALDGSPKPGGRTAVALEAVLEGARAAGTTADLRALARTAPEEVLRRVEAADAIVLGSPVYRASFAYPLKQLLDGVPRGVFGEVGAPLQGKAVAIVATGASLHHFLALNDLRNVLAGFFAAHVVPPGLHVAHSAFDESGTLDGPTADLAGAQGRGLVELSYALRSSATLRALAPQA